MYDRMVARVIQSQFNSVQTVHVIDIIKTTGSQSKPQGLNTIKLLKVASKTFGISAHDTMKVAEHLYLRGYIT